MSNDAVALAAARLKVVDVENPLREAQRLWELAEGKSDTAHSFEDLVVRRENREPFSHIAGFRDFWKYRFRVTPDVLDPRPETETLVEQALARPFSRALDLGTGSGCVLISLLADRPEATGVGTDISETGILVAGENAERIGVANRIVLPLSDWYADIGGRFDLIVSNPPYIAADDMPGLAPEVRDHEPRIALTDGADGLTAYRKIADGALDHLTPDGRLLVEIGPTQAVAVSEIFQAAGLDITAIHPDLDGRDRVVEARPKPA